MADRHDRFIDEPTLHILVFDQTGRTYPSFLDMLISAYRKAGGLPESIQKLQMCSAYLNNELPPAYAKNDGFMAVACGVIDVEGKLFEDFAKTCATLAMIIADDAMIERWKNKSAFDLVMNAMQAWEQHTLMGSVQPFCGLF
jgi:hypothetical protein